SPPRAPSPASRSTRSARSRTWTGPTTPGAAEPSDAFAPCHRLQTVRGRFRKASRFRPPALQSQRRRLAFAGLHLHGEVPGIRSVSIWCIGTFHHKRTKLGGAPGEPGPGSLSRRGWLVRRISDLPDFPEPLTAAATPRTVWQRNHTLPAEAHENSFSCNTCIPGGTRGPTFRIAVARHTARCRRTVAARGAGPPDQWCGPFGGPADSGGGSIDRRFSARARAHGRAGPLLDIGSGW